MTKTPSWIAIGTVFLMLGSGSYLAFAQAPGPQAAPMSFFITSVGMGKGGDLGGLAGADAYCQRLAAAAGGGAKTWHAYLSLSAADERFVRRAYADVSMRDLAEAAEVTTGALYHHFPSKEQLYYAMLTAYLGRVRQFSLEAIPASGSCRVAE